MILTKFKVCPACNEHNPPALLECKKCETDLTGIKIVDEAGLSFVNESVKSVTVLSSNYSLVKTCDCGTVNSPQARKCSSCGEDISDIRAMEVQSSLKASNKAVLRSINDEFIFPLETPVTIIGREAEMRQYLEVKTYVSRKHAKFTIVNGEVYVENMSSTNYTFVNNTLIPANIPYLLKNGDEIGIGGKMINGERQNQAAYFIAEVSV
ncbi:FHA domain-containing protein [Paenibacillus sp. FSL R10-2734]|uniref:FHA domain-containing protein n=1 Tax=Paenibacillus sp. FSL R10-2734 TaxID=2954691 RepID=UPI0030DC91D0